MAKHQTPAYLHDGARLVHAYPLTTGNVLRFIAEEVRKERTGTHASIAVTLNWVSLAYSVFNVGRDEERTRLVNSAYQHLGEGEIDASEWTKLDVKHALDAFCSGLWSEFVMDSMGYMMAGDDSKQPPQLIRGAVVEGGGSLLFGPPGRGKTTTGMLMAVSLDAGIEELWVLPDGPRRCLYINLERSKDSLQYRLARVNRALGLPPERELAFINARGRSLMDIFEAAQRTIRQLGIDVVFLDSISRMGGGSLIDDEAVNRVMDRLNELPTWIALAHSPRQDATHAFGSQMFDAACDIAIQIRGQTSADGLTSAVGLQVTKRNDIPMPALKVIALEWTPAGLTRVRVASPGEFPEVETGRELDNATKVRELLLHRGPMTATQVAHETGISRSTVSSLFGGNNHFVPADKQEVDPVRKGNEVFYTVRW